MTYEQKQEAIKALVYGGTQEAAADAAGVPVYLKEMGWLD